MKRKTESTPTELSTADLASVTGGARKWCCRNGRWYLCGQGKRPS